MPKGTQRRKLMTGREGEPRVKKYPSIAIGMRLHAKTTGIGKPIPDDSRSIKGVLLIRRTHEA